MLSGVNEDNLSITSPDGAPLTQRLDGKGLGC